MNCFENSDSIHQFIKTVSIGDKLVLYPRHLPRSADGNKWGIRTYSACDEDVIPEGDECNILHGDAPVFVEVRDVMVGFPNTTSIHHAVYFKEFPVSPRMSVKLHMFIEYRYATGIWEYHLFAKNSLNQCPDTVYHYSRLYCSQTMGVFHRDAFCVSILAASVRHTERAMMRVILAKKMGDHRAGVVIAREFFPFL